LLSVVDEIEAAEIRYRRLGANASLFTIAEAATVADRVGAQEMKSLYKDTFSRKGSKARHIYDAIKNAPQNGICPICGQRVISTLDHYLACPFGRMASAQFFSGPTPFCRRDTDLRYI
jgi:hypothetical protein